MSLLKQIGLFAILLSPITSFAYDYDIEVSGLYYNLKSDGTATVTRGPEDTSGNVRIPKTITIDDDDYKVVEIEHDAFMNCLELLSVEIPETVHSIGREAFARCINLQSVELTNSVIEIGEAAFFNCESLLSFDLPDNINIINKQLFSGCNSLKTVEIPDNITEIGEYAFYSCESLQEIYIPDTVTVIGMGAFCFCLSITNAMIPSSVIEIGEYAFQQCESLENVIFEDGDSPIQLNYAELSPSSSLSFTDSPLKEVYLGRNLDYYTYVDSGDVINYGYSPFFENRDLETISLGKYVTDAMSIYPENKDLLKLINCYNPEPPLINGFTEEQYENVIVNIPEGTLEAYQNDEVWGKFWNFNESLPNETSIDSPTLNEILHYRIEGDSIIFDYLNDNQIVKVFNIDGQLVYQGSDTIIKGLKKGLYIIKVGKYTQKILI